MSRNYQIKIPQEEREYYWQLSFEDKIMLRKFLYRFGLFSDDDCQSGAVEDTVDKFIEKKLNL